MKNREEGKNETKNLKEKKKKRKTSPHLESSPTSRETEEARAGDGECSAGGIVNTRAMNEVTAWPGLGVASGAEIITARYRMICARFGGARAAQVFAGGCK